MAGLLDSLNQALGDDTVNQISQRIGARPDQTKNAIDQALPMLLGALGLEASDPQRAPGLQQALTDDHDGSVIDNVSGYLSGGMPAKATNGQGILDHVLGDRQQAAKLALSKKSGLDLGMIVSLLPILAPIVMGLLGKHQRTGGSSISDLAGMLGGATQQAADGSPDIG